MNLKNNLKILLYKISGLSIYKKLPFGVDLFNDLSFYFKNYDFKIFFDVGANIGQSVNHIKKYYPKSSIYCFEPLTCNFNKLIINTKKYSNVRCHKIAFGSENNEINIPEYKFKESYKTFSLKNISPNIKKNNQTERLEIITLSNFCKSNGINKIDYLKIDTEGFDLEVLKGAVNMLSTKNISFIETEVGICPNNSLHVPLNSIKQFLEKFDYKIYGFYEQMHDWKNNLPVLRRVNVLFIHSSIKFSNKKIEL